MRTVGNMRTVSVSEAKASLAKLVREPGQTVLLRQNQPVAALVSIEDYNDYLSLQRLARHPALFDRLRTAAKKARVTPIRELRKLEDLERRVRQEDEGAQERTLATVKPSKSKR